ncbi:glycosyl transferase [Rhizobium sp. NFR03]|uniref:O-linked N-acetylglucosamine transferase, SPINDLY family protein n=1 Tax=Rhizobium sp. NFR03 TaxID=1566263 RepID=UPI000B84FA39|nr:glycosyl transferase [Rhizobium sp. NFR03]
MVMHNTFAATHPSMLASALERSRQQQLSLLELFQIAEELNASNQKAAAAKLYSTWIAFNDNSPVLHLAYFNYSVTLRGLDDMPGAINALQASLKIAPQMGQARINLGRTFEDSGMNAQAVQQWQQYVAATQEITPEKISYRLMALQHIGRVMESVGLLEDAETILWQAIELRPERTEAAQHWLSTRQHQCKWPIITTSEYVTGRQLLEAFSPLPLACYTDDPIFQMAKAYRYNQHLVGRINARDILRPAPRKKTGTAERLRIGYVSSDLRDHAVGFALSEVLELHDKKKVEIFAYYCGEPRTDDATQTRIRAAVDHWHDIATFSDLDAAKQILADEIDILVDVNGYTKHARTKIFAYRPAPVIVNFCGYPGTMASPVHQYIIADEQIIPPENELYYTEKVLRIPCNQPVDRKRTIAPKPTRQAAGLPEDAFVFACFNGSQKTTAACFSRWMVILAAVPGSVLWLLGASEPVNERLRQLAVDHGVEPDRLIFAPKVPNAFHLARIGVADLFLDTFPYGAHSTAADAVTMGLPVLTLRGKGFASRFCGSIVSAAGIPEMICETPDAYVGKAIAYARDPKSLQAVRESLQAQRETCALRDIPALVRRLEELYWQMQGEGERGEIPVPRLDNLDIYYEVGVDFLADPLEFETDASYRERYREAIAQRHAYAPIAHDTRFWTDIDQPNA